MNPPPASRANWIGHLAPLPGSGTLEARVFGSTSRGIFLMLPPARILFLSYEPFRGPLTVNLSAPPAQLPIAAGAGRPCLVDPGSIRFEAGAEVVLAGAPVWSPAPPPAPAACTAQLRPALLALAGLVQEHKSQDGLAPLFLRLVGSPSAGLPPGLLPVASAAEALARGASLLAALPSLEAVLGLGRGLTPSGDDFLVGLLLALHRYPAGANLPERLEFSHRLCAAARQRTTALSAALIEAAAQGSADERLLQAFDGLFTAALAPQEIFALLSAYGSSSGLDALAGACSILQPFIYG